MLIEQYIEFLRSELRYSPNTLLAYHTDLYDWAGYTTGGHPEEIQPDSVTVSDIRAWVADMARRGNSPRTQRRKVQALRGLYNYLMRYHGCQANPAADIVMARTPRHLPEYLRAGDTSRVLDTDSLTLDPDDFTEVRSHLILLLFYTTGIRCAELINLRNADVDQRVMQIRVTGKGSKERLIPYGTELHDAIQAYIGVRDNTVGPLQPGDPLLVRAGGLPLYYQLVRRTIHAFLDGRVQATKRSPHVLRHSFASDMLNAGADLHAVSRLLGHTSLATTQVYTHITYRELQNSYLKAHPRALTPKSHSHGN